MHQLVYVANGVLFYMSYQPGVSGSLRDMPMHELTVGYFLECAAEGMSFFETMDAFEQTLGLGNRGIKS